MMNDRTANARIALVTGANKGLGFEIARQLATLGNTLLIGARDAARGRAAEARLRASGLQAHYIELDVTRRETIAAAASRIEREFGRLDILVNNAGILIDDGPPSEIDPDRVRRTYETNVFGPIAVLQLMLPLLRRSAAGRVVNMSSNLSSFAEHGDPKSYNYGKNLLAYSSSKAALNAVTIQFAFELRNTPIKVNSAAPGHVMTDMSGSAVPPEVRNARRTVEQGAVIAVHLATLPADGPTGGFFNDQGVVPW
jgi:NAD(P)-dependent dehydrogenase (short-subunit alcohol dehydrogenase family)